mgnify:CR=1 FL=1
MYYMEIIFFISDFFTIKIQLTQQYGGETQDGYAVGTRNL